MESKRLMMELGYAIYATGGHCQNIQSTTDKDYLKVLQVGTGYTTFSPDQKQMIETFVGGQSLITRKKTSFVGESFIYIMPALIQPNTLLFIVESHQP